ncbi:MAG: prepilin peptidase [Candidatus Paceibacterota bacterium]
MTYLFIILIGLCVGSFLNVVIFRLDKKDGIFWGRSECTHCNHNLKWYDLIPVLSFLTLKAKCRYCKHKISFTYPFVEIVAALSFFAYFYFRNNYQFSAIFDLFIISGLIIIIFSDLTALWIPDKIIFPLIIVSFVYGIAAPDFLNRLLVALAISSIFAIIYLASRGQWMGFGDVKLVFLMGLLLGYPLGILAVLLSVWAAALVGIALITVKKATLKTALPLGTFLASSSILFIILSDLLPNILSTAIFKFWP